ncbi:hypothetical protein NW752_009329 [Fusarium irregulare]|uniref:F-box domain-containing protein n=1 Tax=Fusarium irregulare TaxID=2494466 RepID=A0A9W8PKH6_9HYPO|nr:hypothetical protein NW766_008864 [Fusarium irregulare]KAJ4010149.1 hypothetical protein NW752_009329 [Fusarium irregulare]
MAQHVFQALPYDIHFEIAKHMPYNEILKLAATNRHFRKVLSPRAILGAEEALEFVTERDGHLRKIGHELFACSNCLRLLPKKKFIKTNSFYDISWSARFCLDCTGTLKTHRHLVSVADADGKLRYYFCHNCGEYRTESEKCQGDRIDSDTKEADAAEALVLCAKPRRERQGIENLPVHILAKISSFLGFADVLHLAQVSRALNDIVKPNQWVPLHERYQYIDDKWTQDVHAMDPDKIPAFPCYICCKIYPKKKFTEKHINMAQEMPETIWRMRCHQCVWRMGMSPMSVVRIELRRREMCETCGCIKYARDTCGRCLELYIEGVIDWKTLHPREGKVEEALLLVEGLFIQEVEENDKKAKRDSLDSGVCL